MGDQTYRSPFVSKKTIVTYDEEPSGFAQSTEVKGIRYKLLSRIEYNLLAKFYSTEEEAEKYTRMPPSQVINLMAQLKVVSELKGLNIRETAPFTIPEAALIADFVAPPGAYGDRHYLIARWSLEEGHILLTLQQVRESIKQTLMNQRRQALLGALKEVEKDTERYMNDEYSNSVSF